MSCESETGYFGRDWNGAHRIDPGVRATINTMKDNVVAELNEPKILAGLGPPSRRWPWSLRHSAFSASPRSRCRQRTQEVSVRMAIGASAD